VELLTGHRFGGIGEEGEVDIRHPPMLASDLARGIPPWPDTHGMVPTMGRRSPGASRPSHIVRARLRPLAPPLERGGAGARGGLEAPDRSCGCRLTPAGPAPSVASQGDCSIIARSFWRAARPLIRSGRSGTIARDVLSRYDLNAPGSSSGDRLIARA
jgi:hypothetical protein